MPCAAPIGAGEFGFRQGIPQFIRSRADIDGIDELAHWRDSLGGCGTGIFSGFPVSSSDLRPDRIIGQPAPVTCSVLSVVSSVIGAALQSCFQIRERGEARALVLADPPRADFVDGNRI